MDENKLKKLLIGLGATATTITGLLIYLQQPISTQPMGYYEYLALLRVYNRKIEYIKANCDTDKRCLKDKGEPKVILQDIQNKENIINQLNTWLRTEDSVFVK